MSEIRFIDEVDIQNQTVLVRVDFDVSINPNSFTIADDLRIRQNVPTLEYLLKRNNKVICVAKLGRPKGRDPKYSLKIVTDRLGEYLPQNRITLIDNFTTAPKDIFEKQQPGEIYVLENIRFHPEEKHNDPEFAKKLASLAQIFVNDGFAVSHRSEASVVGVTTHIPGYGGLLLKKEVHMISRLIDSPQKPFVSILGGAKIDTKIHLIDRLIDISDTVILGGGIANTFLYAQGIDIKESFAQKEAKDTALAMLQKAKEHGKEILLPVDCIVGNPEELEKGGSVVKAHDVPDGLQILDIGPETQARIGAVLASANTIVWNGPVGYFENPHFRQGTDFVYYTITNNAHCTSVVGGGDTLAAIAKKEYVEKITHISTGGGAMLEFIEKGTLPGIEALKK